MKYFVLFFLLSIKFISVSQEHQILAFNFDSTKVFVAYVDILPVLKWRNEKLKAVCKQSKKDTLLLDGTTLFLGKHNDSLVIDLDYELFTLIDQKKARIFYKQQSITSFNTKKIKLVKDGRKQFVGLYYYDDITKKHFITKTLFIRWNPVPFPHF